jgi:hypothetical protein
LRLLLDPVLEVGGIFLPGQIVDFCSSCPPPTLIIAVSVVELGRLNQLSPLEADQQSSEFQPLPVGRH